MYMVDMRKHDKPEPRHTAKHSSLCVVVSLNVNRFQKLGFVVVASSLIKDLNEYCELNILNSLSLSISLNYDSAASNNLGLSALFKCVLILCRRIMCVK